VTLPSMVTSKRRSGAPQRSAQTVLNATPSGDRAIVSGSRACLDEGRAAVKPHHILSYGEPRYG
jgi:hypothetical protein